MSIIATFKKKFSNDSLLDQSLTHRSWVNEHPGIRTSNERLEFLGDAILEFIVSEELFTRFPDKEEGYMTALRANLVNTVHLSEVARKLDLGSEIFLSKGEEEGGGRDNPSLLADTVEAIIGAIYMDLGLSEASNFIHEYLLVDLEKKLTMPLKDAKSRLQEYVQSYKLTAPKYIVTSEDGPDHAKHFEIEVLSGKVKLGQGKGKSKSEAEQNAAQNALDKGDSLVKKAAKL